MAREPLFLDVRAKPGGLDTSHLNLKQGNAELRAPEQSDVTRFQQQMNASEPEASPLPSGPFALFGQGAAPGVVANAAAPMASAPVRETLHQVVKRLLVGDGREGLRSVRMGLADDVMPGVEVEVFQDSGAWVASFECRDPSSFERLAQPANQMAQELALAVQGNATWRVKPAENLPAMAHLSMVEAHATGNRAGDPV